MEHGLPALLLLGSQASGESAEDRRDPFGRRVAAEVLGGGPVPRGPGCWFATVVRASLLAL